MPCEYLTRNCFSYISVNVFLSYNLMKTFPNINVVKMINLSRTDCPCSLLTKKLYLGYFPF